MKKRVNVFLKTICVFMCFVMVSSFLPLTSASAAGRVYTYKDFKYSVAGNEVRIESYRGTSSKLVFPDKIKGKKVTNIAMDSRGESALRKVKEVTIGRYVEDASILSSHMFNYWTKLSNISVDSKNERYFSQDGVLFERNNGGLELTYYPGNKVETDGVYRIPQGTVRIAQDAFSDGKKLKQINIPASLTGYVNFDGCDNLKKIYVTPSNKVYASKDGSLYNKAMKKLIKCPNLLSMQYKFPKSVTTIESAAFSGNTKLKEIVIPKQIKKIGQRAFEDCVNLKTVRFKNIQKKISPSLFINCKIQKLIIEDMTTDMEIHKGNKHESEDDTFCNPITGCFRLMMQKGLGRATLYCKKGSKAEQTALKYNLRMTYMK